MATPEHECYYQLIIWSKSYFSSFLPFLSNLILKSWGGTEQHWHSHLAGEGHDGPEQCFEAMTGLHDVWGLNSVQIKAGGDSVAEGWNQLKTSSPMKDIGTLEVNAHCQLGSQLWFLVRKSTHGYFIRSLFPWSMETEFEEWASQTPPGGNYMAFYDLTGWYLASIPP